MKLPVRQMPESYRIYMDQFDDDPEGTLIKLENHVTKRNGGAVGYYILSVLNRKAGRTTDAIKYALTAKILAPGSEFFRRLPYYIKHPDFMDAWVPDHKKAIKKREPGSTRATHPIRDLDQLITRLSEAETRRIKIPEGELDSEKSIEDLSKRSADVDDIVTETLALIHEKQGNYKAAIDVFKQLRQTKSSKHEHYDEQILRLRQLMEG